ncbi:MAG: hypothetical protein WC358_02385 [Ignavibacteria bacterium]|jgi:beta-mannosidase
MLKQFYLIFLFTSVIYSQSIQKKFLNDNWFFTESGTRNWLPASVPGNIHTDLLNNKIIANSDFWGNEKKLLWIEEKDWDYKTTFSVDEIILSKQNIEIAFEGLDTYANVYLNDSLIIRATNMFRMWQCNCKGIIKKENNNLFIQFLSPSRMSDSIASLSEVKLSGDKLIYLRKTPYRLDYRHIFASSGIWKSVYLLSWNDLKIEDVSFQQENITPEQVELHVPFFLNCFTRDLYKISIKDTNNMITYAEKTDSLFEGYNLDALDFNLYNPRLWWTRELGTPEMYAFRFEVRKNNYVVDEKIFYIGIRKIEHVNEKDSLGRDIYFKLNNVPLYIKGANYISQENYIKSLKIDEHKILMKDINRSGINMFRVRGDGIYEDDEFYNQCDLNGILVWQDFMFSDTIYPGESDFLENVRIEVSQNISRLKNHPCIALWCGNNEIYEDEYSRDLQKQLVYSKKESINISNNYKMIFENIIPEALNSIVPSANYIPSSSKISRDLTDKFIFIYKGRF